MRSKQVIKNGIVGIAAQIVTMLVAFVTRKLFVHYLGLDILCINGVIANVLSMLSLAELGIGTAITYNLYKPLVGHDENTVASLMKLYERIYQIIGTIILVIGLVLMFGLKYIIKDQPYEMPFIRIVYIIQLLSIVSTYFLAYKRTLIYADQKQYVCTIYDTAINLVASILRIIVLVLFKSYILYLIIQIIQTVVSNILISLECNKRYPYLKMKNIPVYEKKMELFKDTKNVMYGKLASYVYGATDNIVISTFLGVRPVGLLSNYTFIVGSIKTVVASIINPIQPIIGNYLNSQEDKSATTNILNIYTYVRYLVASFCITPLIILIQPFIVLWLGNEYVMSINIMILICIDFFIGLVHGPVGEYINGLGMFKYEKYISIIGAVINLTISIFLVRKIGIEGVLFGTIVSQMFFWVGRSSIVFKYYFKKSSLNYWIKNLYYSAVCIAQVYITAIFVRPILEEITIGSFVLAGILTGIVPFIINIIAFYKTEEFMYIKNIVLSYVKKKNI